MDSTDFTKYDIELYIQDCAFTIVVKTQDLFDEVQDNFLKLNPNKREIISWLNHFLSVYFKVTLSEIWQINKFVWFL